MKRGLGRGKWSKKGKDWRGKGGTEMEGMEVAETMEKREKKIRRREEMVKCGVEGGKSGTKRMKR